VEVERSGLKASFGIKQHVSEGEIIHALTVISCKYKAQLWKDKKDGRVYHQD